MELSEKQKMLNEDIKYLLNLNSGNSSMSQQKVSLNALYAINFLNNDVIKLFNELYDLTQFNDPSLRLFEINDISKFRRLVYENQLMTYHRSSDMNQVKETKLNNNILISQLLYKTLKKNSNEFQKYILQSHIMKYFEPFLDDNIKNKLKFEIYYTEDEYSNKCQFILNDDDLTNSERQDLIISINLFKIYYNQYNKSKSELITLYYKFNELNHLSHFDKCKIYLKSTLDRSHGTLQKSFQYS